MDREHRYDQLLKSHLLTLAPAYFLYSLVFLYAYELANDKTPTSSPWVPLTLSFVCIGLSLFLGVGAFSTRIRAWKYTKRILDWISRTFAIVGVGAFLLAWLGGITPLLNQASSLTPIFVWTGMLWFVVLGAQSIYSSLIERGEVDLT